MLEDIETRDPDWFERLEHIAKEYRIEDTTQFALALAWLGLGVFEANPRTCFAGTSYELPPRLQQGDRVKVVKDYEDPEGPWIHVTGTLKLKLDRPTFQSKTWIVTMDKVPEDCGDPGENEAWWHESELERIMEE